MTDPDRKYTPNPTRLHLAKELAILNRELIKLGLDDRARLLRLRLFAESSRTIDPNARLPGVTMTDGVDETSWNHRWTATFRRKHLGTFPSPREAHEAYRRAHVAHFGERSQYHERYVPPVPALDEELPVGVTVTDNGFYQGRINLGGKVIRLGIHPTPEAAHDECLREQQAHEQQKQQAREQKQQARGQAGSRLAERDLRITQYGDIKLPRGVSRTADHTFRARINIGGRMLFLGVFKTPDEAHEAFKQAHIEHHGERSRYFKEATHA